MATANLTYLMTVDEYLNTTFRPDVDYVDGVTEERNLGEFDHGDLQLAIGALLRDKQKGWGVRVVVETRTRVSPTRFRIPDCCVVSAGIERERIITTPPLLCVEVLSPRDSLKSMRRRVQDFFDMGVKTIWIFDPEKRIAYDCGATTMTEHISGTLRVAGTPIELTIEDVFATLDS
jgi:Uma2 family endonuclease